MISAALDNKVILNIARSFVLRGASLLAPPLESGAPLYHTAGVARMQPEVL
jgi:hypothetical protein